MSKYLEELNSNQMSALRGGGKLKDFLILLTIIVVAIIEELT